MKPLFEPFEVTTFSNMFSPEKLAELAVHEYEHKDPEPMEIIFKQQQLTPGLGKKDTRYNQFYSFMQDLAAWDNFVQVFASKIGRRSSGYDTIEDYLKATEKYSFIDHLCSWAKSPQGQDYWRKINEKWRKFYQAAKA